MAAPLLLDRLAPRGPLSLWLALLAGPTAASLQLSVNYALVKWACAAGGAWVLATIATALLIVSVAGVGLGFAHLVPAGEEHDAARTWSAESRRLLAATAVGLNALIAVFFVNTLIAMAVLSPCE
jgi:hypothetical protein